MSRFQDPNIPARRGLNEFEANRRYRQCLENELIGEQGLTDEQAKSAVKSNYPWLYEQPKVKAPAETGAFNSN
jgi:hypothetical protein